MSKKTVRYTLDTLPALTDAQKAELARLAKVPDSEIDTSDIPELPASAWKNAVRGQFYKPTKTSITARVDSDVVAWLKSEGGGYQSRMNAILRYVMLHPHLIEQRDLVAILLQPNATVAKEDVEVAMKAMDYIALVSATKPVFAIKNKDVQQSSLAEQFMASVGAFFRSKPLKEVMP